MPYPLHPLVQQMIPYVAGAVAAVFMAYVVSLGIMRTFDQIVAWFRGAM